MTLKKNNIIGFDRKIELEWANYMAELVIKNTTEQELRDKLTQKLSVYGLGADNSAALRKTITVLIRLWLKVPSDLIPIRNEALKLYKTCNENDKAIVHLCLAMSNYPFFFDVMTQAGRLLKLQDSFSLNQITRRIVEKWGDTERVRRSTRHVLQTLKIWDILGSPNKTGYSVGTKIHNYKKQLQDLISQTISMCLGNKEITHDSLSHPSLFFLSLEY